MYNLERVSFPLTHSPRLPQSLSLSLSLSHTQGLFDSLRTVLFTDSAVAGEGAALAIGEYYKISYISDICYVVV